MIDHEGGQHLIVAGAWGGSEGGGYLPRAPGGLLHVSTVLTGACSHGKGTAGGGGKRLNISRTRGFAGRAPDAASPASDDAQGWSVARVAAGGMLRGACWPRCRRRLNRSPSGAGGLLFKPPSSESCSSGATPATRKRGGGGALPGIPRVLGFFQISLHWGGRGGSPFDAQLARAGGAPSGGCRAAACLSVRPAVGPAKGGVPSLFPSRRTHLAHS